MWQGIPRIRPPAPTHPPSCLPSWAEMLTVGFAWHPRRLGWLEDTTDVFCVSRHDHGGPSVADCQLQTRCCVHAAVTRDT